MKGLSPEQLVAKYTEDRGLVSKDVLSGLDAVDWRSIQDAYGDAVDVPVLLCASLSSDKDDRSFAFRLLFETICHQGSVYEASAYAVPFLFQMLQSPLTPDKNTVALLLACLANGQPGTDLEPKYQWVQASQRAVEVKLSLLYPFIESSAQEVRASVATALSLYPTHSHEIRPLLEKALVSENSPVAAAAIQKALDKLPRKSSPENRA